MAPRRLDFVVGGAQKSGTTTLDGLLRLHPQIEMARIKETHFFDDEGFDWARPDYSKLHSYFGADEARLRGEATPVTLYWRPAIRRLHAYNPGIKIVLILRNPVTRAFANWKKEYAAGLEDMPFDDVLRAYPERVRAAAETEGLHRVFSYVERGFYGAQLSHLAGFFPRAQIHCEIYEEFFADRAAGLERIAAFLGTAPFPAALPELRRHTSKDIAYPSVLSPGNVADLSRLYRDDIAAVEAFLGRALPGWRQVGL